MYISKIRVQNYKSFFDSRELTFAPGFNIIVGKNNSGKTALLEALGLSPENCPHLDIRTKQKKIDQLDQGYKIDILLSISPDELFSDYFPLFNEQEYLYVLLVSNEQEPNPFASQAEANRNYSGNIQAQISSQDILNAYDYRYDPILLSQTQMGAKIHYSRATRTFIHTGPHHYTLSPNDYSTNNLLFTKIVSIARERIYLFKAEKRINDITGSHKEQRVLANDASNLCDVLNNFFDDIDNQIQYSSYVKYIIDNIERITIRNTGSVREVITWPQGVKSRSDLAVPLRNCGTGVGHILSILYVVMAADFPQTIIIDEPQSFLHPGSLRKLIEVLKDYPQHQYIIATHSPTIVTATNPSTVHYVQKENTGSIVSNINIDIRKEVFQFIDDLGIRFSDVFGADNILWVEGPTEEKCFTLIVQDILKRSLMGTSILAVLHTGDFDGKHKKTIIDIYKRLSSGNGLVPPAIGFIFDREDRSNQEIDDIKRPDTGYNLIKFLPRRLYENYLLNYQAISHVLGDALGASAPSVADIQRWIDENRRDSKYWKTATFDQKTIKGFHQNEEWKLHIHAAKILEDLFNHFGKVKYQKTFHSYKLTQYIVEHSPEELEDIVHILKESLSRQLAPDVNSSEQS